MKREKPWVNVIVTILKSVPYLGTLIFSLLALRIALQEGADTSLLPMHMCITFACIAISRLPLMLRDYHDKNKVGYYKNLVLGLVYLVLAIMYIFCPVGVVFYTPLASVYMFGVAASRLCYVFEKKGLLLRIANILLALLFGSLGVAGLTQMTSNDYLLLVSTELFVIMVVSLVETLAFALSRIQLRGILKIMRRTYAFEVLYGLVILIISCSFYFTITEPQIETFGDGLWYSFAVVTTIGFGDYTVVSPVSRILSVVLGIYGLVVVAVITSIIVNFYNDTKGEVRYIPVEKTEKKEEEKIEEPKDEKTEEKK